MLDATRRREEAGLGVLGIESDLDCVTGRSDGVRVEPKRLARRDPELVRDQVATGHQLGHRVLDLETGAHLEEGRVASVVEMNTRLQVEHPVTELVTGRDLVADQLRIAAGEALGFDTDTVRPDRPAVEVRLYAEDAEAGFLPATGRVEYLRWPSGEGIRVDAGIDLGTEIGDRFDPMLAKIVAWGPDRAAAFERLAGALDATVVLGVVTNLRFLRWLVRQPVVSRRSPDRHPRSDLAAR